MIVNMQENLTEANPHTGDKAQPYNKNSTKGTSNLSLQEILQAMILPEVGSTKPQ